MPRGYILVVESVESEVNKIIEGSNSYVTCEVKVDGDYGQTFKN